MKSWILCIAVMCLLVGQEAAAAPRSKAPRAQSTRVARVDVVSPAIAADTTAAAMPAKTPSRIAWLPLILFVAVSAAGTAGVLFFVWKRQTVPTMKTVQGAQAAPQKPTAMTPVNSNDNDSDVNFIDEEPEEIEDDPADLAQRFGRGKGELALALRLRVPSAASSMRTELNAVSRTGSTPGRRVQVARKLGLGRGEVDLAIHLKEFAEAHGTTKEQP